MTDQPIDPAATPDDNDAAQIAADDAGASAFAERAARQARQPDPDSLGSNPGERSDDDDEDGLDGEGV